MPHVFTLSGAICWVGKQAQLNTNPVSLGEGWQLITQAHHWMTHWTLGDLGCTCSIPPAWAPFLFCNLDQSLWAARPSTPVEWWGRPKHDPRTIIPGNEAKHYRKTKAKGDENYGQTQPCHLHPHQITGSRVIEVQHQLSSSASSRSDRSGIFQAFTPRLTMHCRESRDPHENQPTSFQGWGEERHCHLPKLALGLNSASLCWDAKTTPFFPMLYVLYKVTQVSWWGVQGQMSL